MMMIEICLMIDFFTVLGSDGGLIASRDMFSTAEDAVRHLR